MRTALIIRIFALLLAIGVIAFWAASGADRGWTKTTVPVQKLDPITEIEFVEYEKRFVPGVDFLIAGIGASIFLFGTSFLFRKPKPTNK